MSAVSQGPECGQVQHSDRQEQQVLGASARDGEWFRGRPTMASDGTRLELGGARLSHNLIYYNGLDKGGHFAPWEQPELFTGGMRAAFRWLR